MIDYIQNDSMIDLQSISSPPLYYSIALTGDQMVYDTASKIQRTIGDTYLTMEDFHDQLVRFECTNQLLITGLSRWIYLRGKALSKAQYLIGDSKCNSNSNNDDDGDDGDYMHLLDRMTLTVLQLLEEAQSTLDRMVTTRRRKAPCNITTSINALRTKSQKRSKTMSLPDFTRDQRSRYQTSQQKLNQTFEQLIDQVNSNEVGILRSAYPTPLLSPKSIRRSSLTPPSPILEKHTYHDDDHHYHHYNDYSPPPSPLPRQTMELSYWALYNNSNDDDEDDDDDDTDDTMTNVNDRDPLDCTDTILTTATSRSVKLVHSCLSPLLRLASSSTYSPVSTDEFATLPPPLPSRSSSSLLSSSSSYSLASLASSSSTQHQITTTSNLSLVRHRRQRLGRIAFNVLVISRLLLHRHLHPSSSFNSNLHLLRPGHQHLWRQYLLIVFGSSPSISPLPSLCQKMLRLFYIVQFTYSLSS